MIREPHGYDSTPLPPKQNPHSPFDKGASSNFNNIYEYFQILIFYGK
jgi:hypothetical protein